MSPVFRRLRVELALVPLCLASFCLCANALVQQDAGGRSEPGTQIPPASSDFEVKIVDGNFWVRPKGSQAWKRSSELKEPVTVGLFDGDHKIYVVSKALKPPKAKHTQEPGYPPGERKSGRQGRVLMHILVDEQGAVRFPAVDVSTEPKFAEEAIKTVEKWSFEPATLSGQAVAALIIVTIEFRVQ
jgi:TonB family protein